MLQPHKLLDKIKADHNFKSDRALAQFLETEPPFLSRVRLNKNKVGATLILAIHEKTGMPVAEIREYLK